MNVEGESTSFYVPYSIGSETSPKLPLCALNFVPLKHVPLYTSKQEAALSLTAVRSRHNKGTSDESEHWVSGVDKMDGIVLMKVTLPVTSLLSLPVALKGKIKNGLQTFESGPFQHFAVGSLDFDHVQYEGEPIAGSSFATVSSFPAHVSWSVFKFVFETMLQRPLANVVEDMMNNTMEALLIKMRFLNPLIT